MTREEATERLKMILEESTAYEDAVCYVTSDDADALDMAIKALDQKWIPVSERLPEEDDEFLCTIQTRDIDADEVIDEYINFCDFTDGSWCVPDNETVTAWMPLPELYKAESEEE